jgi:hypothetical protein
VKQRITLAVFIALSGTTGAPAQSPEGRQACMNDAFQFCQDAIPDRERVFRCLESRKDVISAACRSTMAPSVPVNQPPVKEQASQAKSTKGNATYVKRASKTSKASKAKTSKASKTKASKAKASKTKASKASKHSKAVSRRDRKPLNIVPH